MLPRRFGLPATAAAVVVVMMASATLLGRPEARRHGVASGGGGGGGTGASGVKVEWSEVAGVDVVLRTPRGTVSGIVLALHGCAHGGYDWALPHECDGCVGLPEEAAIAAHAAEHSFVLAAPSSVDRASKCWRPDTDGPRLAALAGALRKRFPRVPLFAFGASSGGAMAMLLPRFVGDVSAVASLVMALPLGALETAVSANGPPTRYPATLFLHMARDERTARAVAENKRYLKSRGAVAESITLHPSRVTAGYLAAKLALPADAAADVVRRLGAAGILAGDGTLAEDPRRSAWRDAVRGSSALRGDSLVADASPLSEVLNVAWAMHEIFSDTDKEVFAWFERHKQRNRWDTGIHS